MVLTLLLFLFLTILIPYIRFKMVASDVVKNPNLQSISVVGHRGAAGLAPENTLASFRKALEIGVDIVELDVHLTKDGHVVAIHDSNVRRTSNGRGEVADLTLTQIKALDAGSWFDKAFAHEVIPTLGEVLDLVDGQSKVLIEIKWPKRGIYEGIMEKVLHIIKDKNAASWCIVQSFDPRYLQELIEASMSVPFHQLLFGEGRAFPVYHDRSIHFGRFKPVPGTLSVNRLFWYQSTNRKVTDYSSGVFTVNSKSDIIRVINLKAQYIISDRPDLVKAILGR